MSFFGIVRAIFLITFFSCVTLAMEKGDWRRTKELRQQPELPEGLFWIIIEHINNGWEHELRAVLAEHREKNLPEVLNSYTPCGLAPLHFALITSHKKIQLLMLLFENGALPNTQVRENFVKFGARKKIQLSKGWTAAHIALRYCNKNTMQFLLEKGVDFNVPDSQGKLPREIVFKTKARAQEFIKECLDVVPKDRLPKECLQLISEEHVDQANLCGDFFLAGALCSVAFIVLVCVF